MKPLNSDIIHNILSRCPVTQELFRGVYARGALPDKETLQIPSAIVLNSDNIGQRGIH